MEVFENANVLNVETCGYIQDKSAVTPDLSTNYLYLDELGVIVKASLNGV